MKTSKIALRGSITFAALVGVLLALGGCATPSAQVPDITPDGLVRVRDTRADLVYVLPNVNFSVYDKVALIEPTISFRKDWQSYQNSQRTMRRISDDDLEEMIENGKKLLFEEFSSELKKGGYAVVSDNGPSVLAVKCAIVDLDIFAPDPDNMAGLWTKTYTDGAGEATLVIELYDSVTRQVLARAYDRKSDMGDGFSWRIPRDQRTNIQDARRALGSWAEMLVRGLERAKQATPADGK